MKTFVFLLFVILFTSCEKEDISQLKSITGFNVDSIKNVEWRRYNLMIMKFLNDTVIQWRREDELNSKINLYYATYEFKEDSLILYYNLKTKYDSDTLYLLDEANAYYRRYKYEANSDSIVCYIKNEKVDIYYALKNTY